MSLSAATCRTPLRLTMAAVLLLAASASSASASCGDYVHVLPPGQAAAQPDDGSKPPPPGSPCSQGRCEKAPAPSAPVPSPVSVPGGQVLDAVISASPDVDTPTHRFGWCDHTDLPRLSPSAIFHPPRA